YELLINKIMASREPQEQEDDETQHKVKLNRYFIEHITRVASGKTYWENIKESYRKGGFIFIHLRSNQCVVIPERILPPPMRPHKPTTLLRHRLHATGNGL
ncbi:hypothetical protein GQM09_32130, partial [Escherichia coli]|nr:hypothetical protein [Escherichia coli]